MLCRGDDVGEKDGVVEDVQLTDAVSEPVADSVAVAVAVSVGVVGVTDVDGDWVTCVDGKGDTASSDDDTVAV